MQDVRFKKEGTGKCLFYIMDNEEQLGEMEVTISNTEITVYHTEVDPKEEGKGLAKKLLETMVGYARKNALQVVPLCPYVLEQFKRHPQEYADVWKNSAR